MKNWPLCAKTKIFIWAGFLAFCVAHNSRVYASDQMNAQSATFEPGSASERIEGVLPNGLAYVIERSLPGSGRVSARLAVRVGFDHEGPREEEFAHLIEHAVLSGTRSFPGSLNEVIAKGGLRGGGGFNASTGYNGTSYRLSYGAGKLKPELVAKILADIAGRAILADQAIATEGDLVRSESSGAGRGGGGASLSYSDLQNLHDRILHRVGRRSNHLRLPVDYAAVRHFYRTWYTPDRMKVIITGDIRPAEWRSVISAEFSELASTKMPKADAIKYNIDTRSRKKAYLYRADVNRASVRAYKIFERGDVSFRDEMKIEILDEMISSLNRRLLGEGDSISINPYREMFMSESNSTRGYAVEYKNTEESCLRNGIYQAMSLLRRIEKFDFSENDFESAKTNVRQRYTVDPGSDIDFVGSEYARMYFEGSTGRPHYSIEARSTIESITLRELNKLKNEIFKRGEREKVAIVMPKNFDVSYKIAIPKINEKSLDALPDSPNIPKKLLEIRGRYDLHKPDIENLGKIYRANLSNGLQVAVLPEGARNGRTQISLLLSTSTSQLEKSGVLAGQGNFRAMPAGLSESEVSAYYALHGNSAALRFGPSSFFLSSASRSERPEAAFEVANIALASSKGSIRLLDGGFAHSADGPATRYSAFNAPGSDALDHGRSDVIKALLMASVPKLLVISGVDDPVHAVSLAENYLGDLNIPREEGGDEEAAPGFNFDSEKIDHLDNTGTLGDDRSEPFQQIYETHVSYNARNRASIYILRNLAAIISDRLLRDKGKAYFQSSSFIVDFGSADTRGVNIKFRNYYITPLNKEEELDKLGDEVVSTMRDRKYSTSDFELAKSLALESVQKSKVSQADFLQWPFLLNYIEQKRFDFADEEDVIMQIDESVVHEFARNFFSASKKSYVRGGA